MASYGQSNKFVIKSKSFLSSIKCIIYDTATFISISIKWILSLYSSNVPFHLLGFYCPFERKGSSSDYMHFMEGFCKSNWKYFRFCFPFSSSLYYNSMLTSQFYWCTKIEVRSTQGGKKGLSFPPTITKYPGLISRHKRDHSTSLKWFRCIQCLIIVYVLCAMCNSALSIQQQHFCILHSMHWNQFQMKQYNNSNRRISNVEFYAKRRLLDFQAVEI